MVPDVAGPTPGSVVVYLECNRDGRCMAHVPSLPGCIVRGASVERVLEHVPEAIEQYLLWERAHRGSVPNAPPAVTIGNVVRCEGGAASGSGGRVALLPSDLESIDAAERQDYFARMGWSRVDLLHVVSGLTDVELRSQPGRGRRSLREILQHVAAAEQWYLARLRTIDRFPTQKTPFDRLRRVREAAYSILAQHDLEAAARVVQKAGEPWTFRKALRRFLEHEREHYLEIVWRLHTARSLEFPTWMPDNARERELRLARVFQA